MTVGLHFSRFLAIFIFFLFRNTISVDLYFRGEKMAKVMGTLAMEKPAQGGIIQTLLLYNLWVEVRTVINKELCLFLATAFTLPLP